MIKELQFTSFFILVKAKLLKVLACIICKVDCGFFTFVIENHRLFLLQDSRGALFAYP